MTTKKYTILAKCFDKQGRQISMGKNSYTKSHPLQKHFAELVGEPARIYLHAEIQALLRSGDTSIHRIRITNLNGKSAEPCAVCKAAIKAYGIKHIDVISTAHYF